MCLYSSSVGCELFFIIRLFGRFGFPGKFSICSGQQMVDLCYETIFFIPSGSWRGVTWGVSYGETAFLSTIISMTYELFN